MEGSRQIDDRSAARQRADAIYEEIRNRICTNRYPPETALHEVELATEFSVSRTPMRRVLSMLEHDDLVTARHGVGTIVTAVEPERLVEVYTVRMILAQAAGDYFRLPFPPESIQRLLEVREVFLGLDEGDVIGFGDANLQYYLPVIDLIENGCLREMHRTLFYQTTRMWLLSLPTMPWAETMAAVADELEELVRVIKLEDPIGLGLVMRNHIFMSRRRVLAGLGIAPGDPRNPV
ncbi:GntR family transcriptional regulator [Pelagibius sp. Alg239-R121]|uniref:GntR family transcriptional regulator n=1 Tax=Pelagibius sp. Alg239-R121 TaxID=2993448 RepID=UPI0024A62642|nr:GntR family transcriptional regulator [Pelagibius sp. Alg239-R121]